MNDRVAGPGELTCIDENCSVSGLQQSEARETCQVCGTSLARMPGAIAAQAPTPGVRPVPVAAAPVGGTSWQSRSPMFRIVVAIAGVLLVWLVTFLIRNPDALHRLTGPEFAVGDCVTVQYAGLQDSDMEKADCAESGSLVDPVYKVTQVQKGSHGICPDTTFRNEPEDTTYCLVMRF
jgi:hypothetical protein